MIAWFALAAALLALAFDITVVLFARRAWRQVAPAVAPMLAMFTASPKQSPIEHLESGGIHDERPCDCVGRPG